MTRDDIMHIANETAGRDGWGCESHLQRFAAKLIITLADKMEVAARHAAETGKGSSVWVGLAQANRMLHKEIPE